MKTLEICQILPCHKLQTQFETTNCLDTISDRGIVCCRNNYIVAGKSSFAIRVVWPSEGIGLPTIPLPQRQQVWGEKEQGERTKSAPPIPPNHSRGIPEDKLSMISKSHIGHFIKQTLVQQQEALSWSCREESKKFHLAHLLKLNASLLLRLLNQRAFVQWKHSGNYEATLCREHIWPGNQESSLVSDHSGVMTLISFFYFFVILEPSVDTRQHVKFDTRKLIDRTCGIGALLALKSGCQNSSIGILFTPC